MISQSVPVFLISFNRGAMLRRVIQSLRGLSHPTEIIVHDNGSDDPITLAILEDLQSQGIRIFHHKAIHDPDQLNQIDDTVTEFFRVRGEPCPFVVSDCDVDLSIAKADVLGLYKELLDLFPEVESVGPMLRIKDIPAHYPLYNRVINRHISQFWGNVPESVETSFGKIYFQRAPIDTTLALHRAGEPFRRMKNSLRIYEPYEACHLDWYLDEIGAEIYAQTSSPNISHWDNVIERDLHMDEKIEHSFYYVVEADDEGRLTVRRRELP